jgi:beta-fructofuranosidase
MKSKLALNLLLFALMLSSLVANAQQTWHFENELLNSSGKSGQPLRLGFAGRTSRPELVKGLQGKGLRTDGYSVWLHAQLPASKTGERFLDGHFALETFPTDTAGFFALRSGGLWLSACLDRFGQLMIGVQNDGGTKYYSSTQKVKPFQWLHIGLSTYRSKVQLVFNGQIVKSIPLPEQASQSGADSLLIGRDHREKKIGILPVTAINGLIDEVSVADVSGRMPDLKLQSQRTPVLAISPDRFKNDFTRPRYHLLPAANWTNETHGLIFYQGLYHVFNQKNGANLFLGQINWGHYTSPDLLSWTEQKPVLTPEPGYDENGIWSGCIVKDDQGKPVIFYSAGGANGINVSAAMPMDKRLLQWQKFAGNPVIKANPKEFARNDFHDPIVWKENGAWYMGVGFGLKENGLEAGTILLYKSVDLKKWQYLHPLFTGDPANDDSGVFWEMPLFMKIDGKYVLLVNKVPVRGKPAVAMYWTGNFVGEKFVPDAPQPKRLEVINRLLSPSVALDAAGRITAIAIIPDETSARETYNRGWTHLYSIPRVWNLEKGKIMQRPHPALVKLRAARTVLAARQVNPSNNMLISKGQQQVEIELELTPGSAQQFGLVIGKNTSGSELTRIYFDVEKEQLVIDQTKSSLRKYVPLQVRTGKYPITPGKPLTLRLFIDGSVVEGFINDQDAFTTRLFPSSGNSNQVELYSTGGTVSLTKGVTWQLKSSNNHTAF